MKTWRRDGNGGGVETITVSRDERLYIIHVKGDFDQKVMNGNGDGDGGRGRLWKWYSGSVDKTRAK